MSIAWDSNQFQKLCDQKDLAAYACAATVEFVLLGFEAEDFEKARTHLQQALDRYNQAERAIAEFRNSLGTETKKENHDHSAA